MRSQGTDARGAPRAGRRWLAAMTIAALLCLGPGAPAGAEPWRSITIGESNTQAQWDELLAYFGAVPEEVDATVTVAQTQEAMGGIFDVSGIDSAYSSTSFICREPGSGVKVTTRNIEVVTPDLYALALVTAGVEDAELVVAAPDDAPALGMTALTGVFSTIGDAPCGAAAADPARQQLALEGLALAAGMGQGVVDADGVPRSADALLETQRTVVSERLADAPAIEAVVAEQEATAGLAFPADERARLVDLMTRLSGADLDWGGFAQGWTVARDPDGTQITLIGTGPALAAGVGGMSRAQPTETPEPSPTATVAAVSPTAITEAISSPATASPAASRATPPAASPVPAATPAASPAAGAIRQITSAKPPGSSGLPQAAAAKPATIAGTLIERDGSRLVVREIGNDRPVAYTLDGRTALVRSGRIAAPADLRPDDRVQLTVDPQSAKLLRLEADPAPIAPAAERGWTQGLGWIAALGLIAAAAVLFARRRSFPWLATRGAAGTRPIFTRPAPTPMTVATEPAVPAAPEPEVTTVRRRIWWFGRP